MNVTYMYFALAASVPVVEARRQETFAGPDHGGTCRRHRNGGRLDGGGRLPRNQGR